jgi:hypothetical protein
VVVDVFGGEGTVTDAVDGYFLAGRRFTRCIGCGCLSFSECALVNPDDKLAERGPGAHLLNPG